MVCRAKSQFLASFPSQTGKKVEKVQKERNFMPPTFIAYNHNTLARVATLELEKYKYNYMYNVHFIFF